MNRKSAGPESTPPHTKRSRARLLLPPDAGRHTAAPARLQAYNPKVGGSNHPQPRNSLRSLRLCESNGLEETCSPPLPRVSVQAKPGARTQARPEGCILGRQSRVAVRMAASPMDRALGTDGAIRQLMDAVRDAIVLVDQAGDIVVANTQAERMFGYQPQELVNLPVKTLIPALLCSEREPVKLFGLHKDGGQFPVEVDLRSLEIEGVKLTSGVIRDTSDQRPAEDLRRRLQ